MKLKETRIRNKMTISEVAKRLEIPLSTYSNCILIVYTIVEQLSIFL